MYKNKKINVLIDRYHIKRHATVMELLNIVIDMLQFQGTVGNKYR